MIFGQDRALELPMMSLYDTGMMSQYINAAKDMYQQGLADMKDFQAKYGEFTSPIAGDVDWYNQNVIGKYENVLNSLYSQGIDPARSPEARAMLRQALGTIDYGQIAKLKQSAENARIYQKEAANMAAQGLLDPEWEAAHNNLSRYSTVQNGIWNAVSPDRKIDVDTSIDKLANQIEPTLSKTKDGKYIVSQRDPVQLQNAATLYWNELSKTPQGQYTLSKLGDTPEKQIEYLKNRANQFGGITRMDADDYTKQYNEYLYHEKEADAELSRNKSFEQFKSTLPVRGSDSDGSGKAGSKNSYDYQSSLLGSGMQASGVNNNVSVNDSYAQTKNIILNLKKKSVLNGKITYGNKLRDDIVNHFSNVLEDKSMFLNRFNIDHKKQNYVPIDDGTKHKLFSTYQILEHTAGVKNAVGKNMKDWRNDSEKIKERLNKTGAESPYMISTKRIFTAPNDTGGWSQYAEVKIRNFSTNAEKDNTNDYTIGWYKISQTEDSSPDKNSNSVRSTRERNADFVDWTTVGSRLNHSIGISGKSNASTYFMDSKTKSLY